MMKEIQWLSLIRERMDFGMLNSELRTQKIKSFTSWNFLKSGFPNSFRVPVYSSELGKLENSKETLLGISRKGGFPNSFRVLMYSLKLGTQNSELGETPEQSKNNLKAEGSKSSLDLEQKRENQWRALIWETHPMVGVNLG